MVTRTSGYRPRAVHVVLLLAVLFVLLFWQGLPFRNSAGSLGRLHGATPGNATLGFGGLYVVSGPGSPRRKHLEEAAAVTEIQLTIPEQRAWSDEDVRNFQVPDQEKSKVGVGSVKAWLSHHLVLHAFLKSGQETALIMEDDVDWDIRLRTLQAPLAQKAARTLFPSRNSVNEDQYPWGPPQDWDLLYLGHCGDYLNALGDGVGVGHHHPEQLQALQHVVYNDPATPALTDLHPFTSSLLTAWGVGDHSRVLHRSKWPLCTFGYAITRRTAERLINEIAPAREAEHDPITAYDAAILTACRDGPLACYSLQPELFHHQEGDSMIATEEKDKHEVHRPPVDAKGLEQTKYRGETSNIDCGFWSGDFYYNGDLDKLRYLREQVTRKGQCLKAHRVSH